MRWIRLDIGWSHSDWLSVLSAECRLAWIELLCYVKAFGSAGRVKALNPDRFARMIYVGEEAVRQLLKAAELHGALSVDGSDWVIDKWRDYQGDEGASERMQRYRERQKSGRVEPEECETVTGVTRNGRNVTDVTTTETETETETGNLPPPSPPLEGGGPRARIHPRAKGEPPASIETEAPASAKADSHLGGEPSPDRVGPPPCGGGVAPAPPDPVEEVLAHLRDKTGRGFAPSGGQARHVKARLRGGASVDDLRLVVDHRAAMWGKDPRMRPYLRPETIFGAGHWEAYLQDAREWADGGRKPIANGKPPRDFRDRVERMLGR